MIDRIPLPQPEELDERNREFLARNPDLNVWKMIARTGIAPEFAMPLQRIFEDDWLPSRDRELMLFRTCRNNGSTYPIPQHRAYGGLAPEVVDAILSLDVPASSPPGALDEWQMRLCVMCDEMASLGRLSPQSVAELVEHYGGFNTACRAILAMSWFHLLTRFVDSTGVPVETGPDPYRGIGGPRT